MIIATVDRPVSWTLTAESPAERVEPVTLVEVKKHLRFDSTIDDTLIETYIAAARMHFEEQAERQCVNATWEYALACAPSQRVIELPRPPLVSVTSVIYDDSTGTPVTMDPTTYRVLPSFDAPSVGDEAVIDPYCPCGRIELATGASWPTTSGLNRSLRIRRVCGYGATEAAMPPIVQATLFLLVAHFYRNREDVSAETLRPIPLGAQALITAFKYTALQTIRPTTSALLSGLPEPAFPP